MNKQEIIEFLHNCGYGKTKVFDRPTHYSKFYTTYNRETQLDDVSNHTCKNSFVITDEMIHDNRVNKQFLLNHLRVLYEHHIAADERAALDDILNPKSSFYSEKNVLNKAFTKESLEEAITQVLFLIDNDGISNIKPKSLIVSPPVMFLAKKLLENGMIEHFPQNLIVNPYIRSNTFAAIITDAQNSFRHFVRKHKTFNYNDNKLVREIECSMNSDCYFTLNNPQGIYVISF
jgi:hypothetical protein